MAECLECGGSYKRRGHNGTFCGGSCRRVFNNRRALRGAVLYDLTMVARYTDDVTGAAAQNALERIEALMRSWEKEDGQRRRWKPARLVFEDTTYLTAVRVV